MPDRLRIACLPDRRGCGGPDRIESRFSGIGVRTKRYRKPTNTRVAPATLLQRIAMENHAVVLALSD